jgi:hypothetical protein
MIERGQTREVPPESKAMGDPCIPVIFGMSGYGRGRNTGMVLPD